MGVSYDTSLIYGFNVDEERFEKWWRGLGKDFDADCEGLYDVLDDDANLEFKGLSLVYGDNAYGEVRDNPWWIGYEIAQAYGVGGTSVNLEGVPVHDTRLVGFWREFGVPETKLGHYLVFSVG